MCSSLGEGFGYWCGTKPEQVWSDHNRHISYVPSAHTRFRAVLKKESVSSTNKKNKAACTRTARLSVLHCLEESAGEPKDIWEHAENPDVPRWARSHFTAGHRVWLGNQTVKFVLPKGNPLGAKYTAARYRSQLPGKRTEEMGESFKIRTRCCILVSKAKPSNVAFVDQLPCVLSRAVWTWPSAWFNCCITEVPLCFLQRSHLGLGFI